MTTEPIFAAVDADPDLPACRCGANEGRPHLHEVYVPPESDEEWAQMVAALPAEWDG